MGFLLAFIVMSFLIALFMPKSAIPEGNTNTPSLDGFTMPTADRSRVIPEVYGTTLIKSGNLFVSSKVRYKTIWE